ncbi:MAG: hypothetical protein U0132_03395 [Gemmatimonadaceae bacterium]
MKLPRTMKRLPFAIGAVLVVLVSACSDSTGPTARTGYITSSTAVQATKNANNATLLGTTVIKADTTLRRYTTSAGYNVPAF